jgi:hypothetical protein
LPAAGAVLAWVPAAGVAPLWFAVAGAPQPASMPSKLMVRIDSVNMRFIE